MSARARARLWSLSLGYRSGAGVSLGRGVEIDLDPGARLEIGAKSYIAADVRLHVATGASLLIGERVFIGHGSVIMSKERIVIASGTAIAEGVSIRDHDHIVGSPPGEGGLNITPVIVGRNVWLSAKSTVTKGCVVGDGAVVAAGAVVTKSVPKRSVVGGVPARIIRHKV